MNDAREARPSAWYCLLAVPLFVAGFAIFLYPLLHGISHITDSLTQVVVPGEIQLELKQAKSYNVFSERHSVVRGKVYSTDESINGLQCNLVPVGGIEKIEMRPARMSTTYDVGGRSGRSMFEFRVPADGKYTFACGYSDRPIAPEVVLAVGSGVGEAISRIILVSLAGMFGGFAGAIAVVITVLVLRARSQKVLTAAQASGTISALSLHSRSVEAVKESARRKSNH